VSILRKEETFLSDTPNIDDALFPGIDEAALLIPAHKTHAPRILILYGSLRPRSFSRLAGEESGRILTRLGAEVRFFNPSGLPLVDQPGADMTKVTELWDLVTWCEGMVWYSPERHGAMTGLMKTQVDWILLSMGAVRPTQGKTLAVMQVSGGSQSFNAVNQMRILGAGCG
jgi:arsenic resistance protein ArsH